MFSRSFASAGLRQAATAAVRPSVSAATRSASTLVARPSTITSAALRPRAAAPSSSPIVFAAAAARRFLSDNTRQAISKAVESAPVVLFMKGTPELPQCGFSRASIQVLGLQGVDPAKFAAFNVLEDDELRSGIKEYSEWPTIPQLYIDGEFVGGCDILVSMHQDGSLAKMLEEKNVLVAAEGGESSS